MSIIAEAALGGEMAYEREWLNQAGAPYLLSLIIEKLETMDEPFVTYGETAEMLERELETSKIFSLSTAE